MLLRRDDDGPALLRDFVADGTITATQLESWPLFKRQHDEGKLNDLLQASSSPRRRLR